VLWNRLKLRAILLLVRRHWGVENDCFKSLDVQWQEDTKPWWTEGNAVQALGMLRLMAYNSTQMAGRALAPDAVAHDWSTPGGRADRISAPCRSAKGDCTTVTARHWRRARPHWLSGGH
jgi:hypothetical protein